MTECCFNVIAHIHNDYVSKFGIPRQSGLVGSVESVIVFEPEYRDAAALRGLEEYTYIWLIWNFSEVECERWSPTVRPPRLGGNIRMGVFATRSPFRPNPIGLSSVKIIGIDLHTNDGPVIYVSGADLMDNTPIFDIKPYIPYADCHFDAKGGFTDKIVKGHLEVVCNEELLYKIPESKREGLIGILEQDPRPAYHEDSDRIYSFEYSHYNIQFSVYNGVVSVIDITLLDGEINN